MLPESLQAGTFGTPVAALNIDGLLICCFNHGSGYKGWEVAFVRDGGHSLNLKVRIIDLRGKVLAERVQPLPCGLDFAELKVDNGSDSHYSHFPDGFFNRPSSFSRRGDDSYYLRWAIDFVGSEIPHGRFLNLVRKADQPAPVTIVRIPNSLFYTERVTHDSVIMTPQGSDENDARAFALGRSNEEIGGAVYSTRPGKIGLVDKAGNLVLGTDHNPILNDPHTQGQIYEISLMNMDVHKTSGKRLKTLSGAYVHGDFHYYYNYIKVSGDHYDLLAPSRVGPRAKDGDCHGVMVSSAVDTLIPLIE